VAYEGSRSPQCNMASARKRFSVVQVLQQLSDDEYFDEILIVIGTVCINLAMLNGFLDDVMFLYNGPIVRHVLLSGESQTAPHYCINFN